MGDAVWNWLVGLGGFVLGILALASKDLLVAKVKLLLDFLYGRFAGSRLLRRAALAKYTRELYRRHREFPVSFQADEALKLPMESVYVPLYGGESTTENRPALSETLRRARHSVVLGVPGAGKTLLLRHESLMWARERVRADSSRVDLGALDDIPVLLELHRLNKDPDLTLEQHVVRHFARHGFPRADTWVAGALGRGDLALYFDGLDEVATDLRAKVVELIKEFADTYADCRIVVTCRVAVYEGQFTEFDQTLRVRDFDEHLIRRFLGGWPWRAGTATDTVDQVLGALRDTPQIMSLARNPLLLTMIAYLYDFVYAGTDQVLPHTRADFYKQVIGSLLADRRQTSYALPLKKAVLQHLALAAQDIPSGTHDRLALPEDEVLKTVRTVLEQQGRDVALAEDVLKEIVHRSGLLLAVDNGERYQFAHLTLQEYLAAIVLAADPAGLLRRYGADPQAWRETVRLWCGVAPRDCTEVVRAVYRRDPVLAFQCLADAHVVDDGLAEEVLDHFGQRLRLGEFADEQMIAAFGLVAGDRRQRGVRVFDFLVETVRSEEDTGVGHTAARALAATNLPRAAEALAAMARPSNAAWGALAGMGDLAVPAFMAPWDGAGAYADTVHMLWTIRTPKAARALSDLLGRAPGLQSELVCAFHLGELLTLPEVEAELRTAPLGDVPERLDWVWRPFAEGPDDPLVKLAGRIAWIIDQWETLEVVWRTGLPTPDPRIVAALCVIKHHNRSEQERLTDWVAIPDELAETMPHSVGEMHQFRVSGAAGTSIRADDLSRYLESSLDSFSSFVLVQAQDALKSAGLSPRRLTLLRMLPDRLQLGAAVALLRQSGFAGEESWDVLPRETPAVFVSAPISHRNLLVLSLVGASGALGGAVSLPSWRLPWLTGALSALAVSGVLLSRWRAAVLSRRHRITSHPIREYVLKPLLRPGPP
ncbi:MULTISPECIES: NACHT domain-containing protein [unclassified Streptomyces]|uniref:NACHT domain-containing protein n=1 Tax=unclassified Streptomyces TaxID=2593676 RepID=UPI002E8069BF|nr:NACHT domain-containing protein [Streptomyces sp. NBC_00589]WTI37648.1 NACHT domain-containing protein [Streptomyces sp. NBC_00775]WUB28674.1 NACHT domain-containing protein [Streptomyces sp. NBC_00589]